MSKNYASFGTRLGAYVIDIILVSIVTSITGQILIAIGLESIAALVNLAIGVSYFAFLESGPKHGTLGKQLLGLQVLKEDGTGLSKLQAVGRYFARILSAIPLLIGFFLPLFRDDKRALHDLVCKTDVLKKEKVIEGSVA